MSYQLVSGLELLEGALAASGGIAFLVYLDQRGILGDLGHQIGHYDLGLSAFETAQIFVSMVLMPVFK